VQGHYKFTREIVTNGRRHDTIAGRVEKEAIISQYFSILNLIYQ